MDSGDAADGSQAKEKRSKNESLDGAKDDGSSKKDQNLELIDDEQMGIRILTRVVDYYFSKWRCPLDDSKEAEDFVRNWLKFADATQLIMQKVQWLKRCYQLRVENKGKKNWVFLDLEDLEFIKLAEFIWGVNGISKSSYYE